MGCPSLAEDTTEGKTECCVGVRGDESTTDEGDASDGGGDRWWAWWSWTTEVASESSVYSEGALLLTLTLIGVDVLVGVDVRTGVEVLPGGRALDGLVVLVLGISCGDFARMVLGCDPVVEVRSVPSNSSPSRTLERDATRGPACDVMCVPLSTLRRPSSVSLAMASASLRHMLFTLAARLKSAAVVAVSGGLGGARDGGGGMWLGGCAGAVVFSSSSSWYSLSSSLSADDASTSVASGVMADFLRSMLSRE